MEAWYANGMILEATCCKTHGSDSETYMFQSWIHIFAGGDCTSAIKNGGTCNFGYLLLGLGAHVNLWLSILSNMFEFQTLLFNLQIHFASFGHELQAFATSAKTQASNLKPQS